MFDLINEIWQTMRTNRLRTILTGIAVAWGIFMLIVLLGIAKGVRTAFDDSPMRRSSNVIMIWKGHTTRPFNGFKEGREVSVHDKDVAALRKDVGDRVAQVSGVIDGPAGHMRSDSSHVAVTWNGVTPSLRDEDQLEMIAGRFITDRDMNTAAKVVVMEERNAKTLFGSPAKAYGSIVDINGLAFKVIGVYKHRWVTDVYIPFTTAQALSGFTKELSSIRVYVDDVESTEEANRLESDIRASIARVETFHPEDTGAVGIWNRLMGYLAGRTAMSILDWVMWTIGLLTLITGIVGVSNIMFVSVRERTHEIGIRRAIGARPRTILTQIILEGVAITTLFGYIGILMGTAVGEIMAHAFADMEFVKDPRVDIFLAIKVTLLLIVSGAFAGLFPALKALKIRPVEALHAE